MGPILVRIMVNLSYPKYPVIRMLLLKKVEWWWENIAYLFIFQHTHVFLTLSLKSIQFKIAWMKFKTLSQKFSFDGDGWQNLDWK